MTIHHARRRRGVSMILVLVSMAMAVILTSAYLGSRDNSAMIGDNVSDAGASRWAAMTGLEIGVAVMQTETDWRTVHPDGRLLDDFPVGAATVDLEIVDRVTGTAPTGASTDFELIARATRGDVTQVATARATVPPWGGGAADLDLSEFALFAADRIKLKGRALVSRWSTSPMAWSGRRLAIGTRSTAAGTVRIVGDAAVIDATLYHAPDASGSLVINATGPAIETVAMADVVPLPASPTTGTSPGGFGADTELDVHGGSWVVGDGEHRHAVVSVASGGELVLEGDATLISDGGLEIGAGSMMLVRDDATVVVHGDLVVTDGIIQVADGATLELYVSGGVAIDGGFIGNASASVPNEGNDGEASWMDPRRIRIFGEGIGSPTSWTIRGTSVVKASLYAPSADVRFKQDAALYGRIAAHRIDLQDDAAVYYDLTLDSGRGYTANDSIVYGADGHLLDDFASLASLDGAALAAISSVLDLPVSANGVTYFDGARIDGELIVNTSGTGTLPPPANEPTDRPAVVEVEIGSFGQDVIEWETSL